MEDMIRKFLTSTFLPNRRRNRAASDGFTLIELMLVIAIVGTLAAIALPNYQAYKEKARIARAVAEIRMLDKEMTLYYTSNDDYPEDLGDLGQGDLPGPLGAPPINT